MLSRKSFASLLICTVSEFPIILHEFCCPLRLAKFSLWQKFFQYRLNVENRCAVYGIKTFNKEDIIFALEDFYRCQTQTVRAILAALCEDADFREIRVITRMPRPGDNLRFINQMKRENHCRVREIFQALYGFRAQSFVDDDFRNNA